VDEMSMIFTPQTGDAKMDEAYGRFLAYVDRYENFPSFFDGFMREVKSDDTVYLNRWLLKVLFTHLKSKHPFDEIYEKADDE
jgi:hypothetical protein